MAQKQKAAGKLASKVAFLTGAGAGIARATAKAFVAEGARVAIIDLNREAGTDAEREISGAGGEALFIETDVTSDDSVRAAVAATGPMSNNGVNVRIGRRQDAALPFQGAIDDVEIYDRALTAAEILLLYTGPPQDTTPPNVSITSPALGAQISGSYPLSANASDNVGVVGVQFFVDGNAVGPEDTTAPYSVSLQTSTLPDGPHVVTARARDAAGNTATSLPINTTIANVAATIGQVSAPITMPAACVEACR